MKYQIRDWSKKVKSRFLEFTPLKKRMVIMLLTMGILFGGIFGFHGFQTQLMLRQMRGNQAPAVTVSAETLTYQTWQPKIRAAGTLRAMHGVNVTTETTGLVRKILFTPGDEVKSGDVLVELNADADIAQLNSLIAQAELASLTYLRDKTQYEARATAKATMDASLADYKSKQAQVAEQAAIVAKKTINAPFSGKIGISAINEGQYLNPGDKIASLQQLDPIYVDFYIPQQEFLKIGKGKTVVVMTDAYPRKKFKGIISALDPGVDPTTRNLYVEGTLDNAERELLPGMYVSVEVYSGKEEQFLTLPQSAISFNPYGEIVFIVKETGKDENGNPILLAHQTFVTVGETRGDQIAILKGLQPGDQVVTSGQLKLKNGSRVVINNSVLPPNNPAPTLEEE